MSKKKFDIKKYKKYSPVLAILAFFVALDVTGVVDVKGKLLDIVTSRAGSKVVDNSEGKNLEAFMKPGICSTHYPWGAPRVFDEAVSNRSLYFCGHRFASQIDPMAKVPLWTHEILIKRDLEIPILTPMPNGPMLNDLFPSKLQAHLDDYLVPDSQYVPGFMSVPENQTVDDVTENFNVRKQRSEESLKQAFGLTNSIPMNRNMRNNMWYPLNAQTKAQAFDYNKVFVISGPVYYQGQTLGEFGVNKIAIPTHFYKIITEPNNHQSISYIIPNKAMAPDGKTTDIQKCGPRYCVLSDFVTTIQEVERVTGMEFYPLLAPYYAVQVKKDINEINKKKALEMNDKINGVIK